MEQLTECANRGQRMRRQSVLCALRAGIDTVVILVVVGQFAYNGRPLHGLFVRADDPIVRKLYYCEVVETAQSRAEQCRQLAAAALAALRRCRVPAMSCVAESCWPRSTPRWHKMQTAA